MKCKYCKKDLNKAPIALNTPNGFFCDHECFSDFELGHDKKDSINPSHYKDNPTGIECIQVTEHMGFNLGNAVKYIWRNAFDSVKHDDGGIEDLKKAIWYLNRELDKRQNQ